MRGVSGMKKPKDIENVVELDESGDQSGTDGQEGEKERETDSEVIHRPDGVQIVTKRRVELSMPGGLDNQTQDNCSIDDDEDAQRRRIARLRMEAEALSGEHFASAGIEQLPADIEESFWRQIIAYETAEPTDLFKLLTDGGVSLPPPVMVSEEHIADRLWETIYFLSSYGCYIENTDHLSDRELYSLLWEELLHTPAILFPDDPNYAYHIDTIGSGSEEDQQIYLTYYADEEDRRHWLMKWPEDRLPARIPLPYDRDRLLPRPYLQRTEQLM